MIKKRPTGYSKLLRWAILQKMHGGMKGHDIRRTYGIPYSTTKDWYKGRKG